MRRGYHIKQKKYKTHEKKQKALNQHGITTVKILSHNLINKRLSTYKVVEEAAPPATPGDDEGEESCKKKEKKCYIRKRQPFIRSLSENALDYEKKYLHMTDALLKIITKT